jgi:hypothetical protein
VSNIFNVIEERLGKEIVTQQQAIKILMLSPCYWLLSPAARKELVLEYCAEYDAVAANLSKAKKESENNTIKL